MPRKKSYKKYYENYHTIKFFNDINFKHKIKSEIDHLKKKNIPTSKTFSIQVGGSLATKTSTRYISDKKVFHA